MSLGIVGDNTQAEVTFHPGYVLTPCVCARWSVLGPGNALRSVATTWPGPGSRALLIFSQCQDIGETGVQSPVPWQIGVLTKGGLAYPKLPIIFRLTAWKWRLSQWCTT